MPTLVVLRHAKSAWPPGVADQDRPLNDRGRRDAPAAGTWLSEELPEVPGLAVVSPARRTQQTWGLVAPELRGDVPVRLDPDVYAATGAGLLGVVRGLPPQISTAVLVGHNPGCEDLADSLAGPGSDPGALAAMAVKYPTAGIAVLRLTVPWAAATPGSAALTRFVVPRG